MRRRRHAIVAVAIWPKFNLLNQSRETLAHASKGEKKLTTQFLYRFPIPHILQQHARQLFLM